MKQLCLECDEGMIEVLYEEVMGFTGSNEEAMRLAGTVHHKEVCPVCHGTEEIEDEEV